MQTAYKRISVIAGFGLLFLLLIANAFITRRELGVQTENQRWVSHTRHVLLELAQTESMLCNAESGQRGYLYTANATYLTPYNAAVANIKPHFDTLFHLTADNPDEQARVTKMRDLSEKKLAELAQTISLFQAGKTAEAKALVMSDVGMHYMDQVSQVAEQINQEETSLYASRMAVYRASLAATIRSIYITTGVAALGLILLTYYILRQIAMREKFAADLHQREEAYRVTLTSIGDGVIATDPDGNVTFLNPIAESLTGKTLAEVRGKMVFDVFPIFNEQTGKIADNPVSKVVSMGIVVGLANHTVLQHADGHLIPIEDSAAPIRNDKGELAGVVLVFRDVSHERKSQEVLRKTEKLASAARLSATVAHEINNPLEAIFNLVFVAKINPQTPPDVVTQLNLAEQELERVAHITRQTLGFYRDSSVSEDVDLQALLESIFVLYGHKFRAKNITIERDFAECPTFRGVPGELKQAISNLISNAADAVPADGTIIVRLHSRKGLGGKTLELVIEDNGPGIPAEYAERIFEPFFTTKRDIGTGLGLWVTKGIIDRHSGTIAVRTSTGNESPRGAAFTINLPLTGFDSEQLESSL